MLERFNSYKAFRATIVDGQPLVFDARQRGIVGVFGAVPLESLEDAEHLARLANQESDGRTASELAAGWQEELAELLEALSAQRAGHESGERWASPIAGTYRHLARLAEELGRIYDAIGAGERARLELERRGVRFNVGSA